MPAVNSSTALSLSCQPKRLVPARPLPESRFLSRVEVSRIHHKRNYLYTGENTTQVTVSCVRFPSCILQILKQEVVSWQIRLKSYADVVVFCALLTGSHYKRDKRSWPSRLLKGGQKQYPKQKQGMTCKVSPYRSSIQYYGQQWSVSEICQARQSQVYYSTERFQSFREDQRTRERGWDGLFYWYLLFSEPGTEEIFTFAFKVT